MCLNILSHFCHKSVSRVVLVPRCDGNDRRVMAMGKKCAATARATMAVVVAWTVLGSAALGKDSAKESVLRLSVKDQTGHADRQGNRERDAAGGETDPGRRRRHGSDRLRQAPRGNLLLGHFRPRPCPVSRHGSHSDCRRHRRDLASAATNAQSDRWRRRQKVAQRRHHRLLIQAGRAGRTPGTFRKAERQGRGNLYGLGGRSRLPGRVLPRQHRLLRTHHNRRRQSAEDRTRAGRHGRQRHVARPQSLPISAILFVHSDSGTPGGIIRSGRTTFSIALLPDNTRRMPSAKGPIICWVKVDISSNSASGARQRWT